MNRQASCSWPPWCGTLPGAKRAEQALRRSEERLRLAMDAASLAEWETDFRTGVVSASPRFRDIFGFPGQEALTLADIRSRYHPEDHDRVVAAILGAVDDPENRYHADFRIVWPNGALRWVEVRGKVDFDQDGSPVRAVGVEQDITGRKAAEQELAEAKSLLDAIFEAVPIGIGVLDNDLRYVRVNRRLAEINGVGAAVHIGKRPDEVLHNLAGLETLIAGCRQVLATRKPWLGVEVSGETPGQPGRQRTFRKDFFPDLGGSADRGAGQRRRGDHRAQGGGRTPAVADERGQTTGPGTRWRSCRPWCG